MILQDSLAPGSPNCSYLQTSQAGAVPCLALDSWEPVACLEHSGSCSASVAWFFVSPPAPFVSYRSSPLASDSTLPVGEETSQDGDATLRKGNKSQ